MTEINFTEFMNLLAPNHEFPITESIVIPGEFPSMFDGKATSVLFFLENDFPLSAKRAIQEIIENERLYGTTDELVDEINQLHATYKAEILQKCEMIDNAQNRVDSQQKTISGLKMNVNVARANVNKSRELLASEIENSTYWRDKFELMSPHMDEIMANNRAYHQKIQDLRAEIKELKTENTRMEKALVGIRKSYGKWKRAALSLKKRDVNLEKRANEMAGEIMDLESHVLNLENHILEIQ